MLRIELVTIPETLFYLLVYLPKRHVSQRPAPEGTALSRDERQELFDRCLASVPDIRLFLMTWFRGAPLAEIKKDNVREWLAWAFFHSYSTGPVDGQELDDYVSATETVLGRKFEDGCGPYRPLRHSVDRINIQHRPLLYYICGVGLMDTLIFLKLWTLGFRHYALSRWCQSFPYRPLSVLSKYRSPARDISYWYRPHTSKTRLPLLYIHGICAGLTTYTDFFKEIVAKDTGNPDNQVGILAVEIMPISFRLTSPALTSREMVRQINQILVLHGWDKRQFVLAGNSYGTIINTHLLRSPQVATNIASVVLVDPVTLWVQMGDVAYNFTAKQPALASEHQLHYFACTDIGVAHTVTRRFVWTENVLWQDELKKVKAGLVVSGRDVILNGPRLRRYIIDNQSEVEISGLSATRGVEMIKAENLEVLYFKDLNHAQVFDFKKEQKLLVDMVWRHCTRALI